MDEVEFENVGFEQPSRRMRSLLQRIACAELIMTVALVLSIAVAATAVSIGMARAEMPIIAAAPR
jgi:hypothetical protein